MENTKVWWKSRAVIGGIVAAVAGVAGAAGVVISPDQQDVIINVVLSLLSIGGGAVAVYGRATAESKIVMKE